MANEKKNIPVQARATVQLTIEVDAGSAWGDDCTCKQLFNQAGKETLNSLNQLVSHIAKDRFDEAGRIAREFFRDVRVIGKPVVTAVLVARKDR